jgi:hypothetical protein
MFLQPIPLAATLERGPAAQCNDPQRYKYPARKNDKQNPPAAFPRALYDPRGWENESENAQNE